MLQVDVDAFAKWLGKNYVPPYKYEEIDCIRWPIEREQQADIWKKKIMEFAKDINVPTNWISVKRRLPEDETIVLAVVCYEVGWYRMLAWHDKHGWHSSADEFDERIDGDYVAFWLPIPELPKEKAGEQSD